MAHIQAPIPENEKERLQALLKYAVLDTLPEQCYDDLTAIAAHICGTPIALISLIDTERQWFKSHHGLDATETPRSLAFCAHAILKPDEVLVVNDSSDDARFRDNPLATGAPHVRFYAGTPLVTPEGAAVGTLCVIDHVTKELRPDQLAALRALGRQVVAQLELHLKVKELEQSRAEILEAHNDLQTFTHILSHDLKTPLRGLVTLTNWIENDFSERVSNEGAEMLKALGEQSKKIIALTEALKDFIASGRSQSEGTLVKLSPLVHQICEQIDFKEKLQVTLAGSLGEVLANECALREILLNLISNAHKYCDKEITEVTVSADQTEKGVVIKVSDNGPGIEEKYQTKIFEVFESLHTSDRFGVPTTGMGLAIVRRLAKKLGGDVSVESVTGSGATFIVRLPKEAA